MAKTHDPIPAAFDGDLQIAWDPTSLQNLMFCPRSYQYIHLDGWRGSSVDLDFGGYAASAFEHFWKARAAGQSKEDATISVLQWLTEATWDQKADRPWGGTYENLWRCTGVEKYRNAKGNAAKCPYSHKGSWFPEPAPTTCGECGSPTETVRQYVPGDKLKNRETLIRLVLWYCDDQPDVLERGLHPYVFPDGRLAVELSYTIPLPLRQWELCGTEPPGNRLPTYEVNGLAARTGSNYLLCGHIDYIGVLGEEKWIVDNKTTTKTLNQKFYAGYNPSMQFDTYDLLGTLALPDLDLQGVMIDAAQTLVGGANFGRREYRKTEALREEQLETILFWIKQAEGFARDYGGKPWPMNKRNCWLCAFKRVCATDPKYRQRELESTFKKGERWNPLKAR